MLQNINQTLWFMKHRMRKLYYQSFYGEQKEYELNSY